MKEIIRTRQEERDKRTDAKEQDEEKEREGTITLLDLLLAAKMNPDYILDECMTFLVAGRNIIINHY